MNQGKSARDFQLGKEKNLTLTHMRTIHVRLIVICISLLLVHTSHAQQSKFHALFLTKFSENVRWPSSAQSSVIGVAGSSEVYNYLITFSKNKPNLKVIQITSPQDALNCNMIFLPKSEDSKINAYVSTIGTKSVLIVSESEKLAGKGSDIGFFLRDGKLQFLVDKSSLEQKKLIMGTNLIGRGKTI